MQSADMLSWSFAGDAIERTINLLNLSVQEDQLQAELPRLGPRVTAQYKDLMQLVLDHRSSLRVEWSSPDSTRTGKTIIEVPTAERVLGVINATNVDSTDDIDLWAVLVGGSLRSGRFELEAQDGTVYAGRVPKEAVANIRGGQLGRAYRAKVRVLSRRHPATNVITTSYELLYLSIPERSPDDDLEQSSVF
jgi:hypothetical protein